MKREKIINSIIDEQKKIVDTIQSSVDRYKAASDLDEDNTSDPEDYAHQTEAKDMQLRFEKMKEDAKLNLGFLESELQNTHTEIESGSLIETDRNYLFVGIPVPVFSFEGKDVITFSEDAPVFENLKGKKVGDQIQFGKNSLQILNIS